MYEWRQLTVEEKTIAFLYSTDFIMGVGQHTFPVKILSPLEGYNTEISYGLHSSVELRGFFQFGWVTRVLMTTTNPIFMIIEYEGANNYKVHCRIHYNEYWNFLRSFGVTTNFVNKNDQKIDWKSEGF